MRFTFISMQSPGYESEHHDTSFTHHFEIKYGITEMHHMRANHGILY